MKGYSLHYKGQPVLHVCYPSYAGLQLRPHLNFYTSSSATFEVFNLPQLSTALKSSPGYYSPLPSFEYFEGYATSTNSKLPPATAPEEIRLHLTHEDFKWDYKPLRQLRDPHKFRPKKTSPLAIILQSLCTAFFFLLLLHMY